MTRRIGTIGRFDGVLAIATLGRFAENVVVVRTEFTTRPTAQLVRGIVPIGVMVKS